MASVILILLVFIFVVIIILLSIGTYILSALFGGFMNLKNFVWRIMGWNTGKKQTRADKTASGASRSSNTKANPQQSAPQSKVFTQEEGTYIDFEEVK